jgi:antitoxin (DNA-binding transcriptional repressor) of toxin-antitoxin stability system
MIVDGHDESIKLIDLIQAAKNGEEIFIVTDQKVSFQLIECTHPKKKYRKAGSAKGILEIADDFDAPIEDFKDYMP